MKTIIDEESLDEIIKEADLAPKRKAFRNHMPYAILKDGEVVLVYPDNHIEPATAERLQELQSK
jgi:hypothetical protein